VIKTKIKAWQNIHQKKRYPHIHKYGYNKVKYLHGK